EMEKGRGLHPVLEGFTLDGLVHDLLGQVERDEIEHLGNGDDDQDDRLIAPAVAPYVPEEIVFHSGSLTPACTGYSILRCLSTMGGGAANQKRKLSPPRAPPAAPLPHPGFHPRRLQVLAVSRRPQSDRFPPGKIGLRYLAA